MAKGFYFRLNVILLNMRKEGTNWSLEFEDGVVIGRFHKDMRMETFEEEVYPAYEEILDSHKENIVASADLVNIADPFSKDVFEVWEEAAQESSQLPNFERAALVSDGVKALSLRSKYDVPGAEMQTFDDLDKAIEWARHGDS